MMLHVGQTVHVFDKGANECVVLIITGFDKVKHTVNGSTIQSNGAWQEGARRVKGINTHSIHQAEQCPFDSSYMEVATQWPMIV